MLWTRRSLAAVGFGLLAPDVRAQTPSPDTFGGDRLHRGRLTVPVRIDDQGPFAFAIDSAANASVITGDLALRLALPGNGDIVMHTLIDREVVGTVRARRLTTGALDIADPRLALVSRAGLDGLDGLLGADLLAGLRLELRFDGDRRMRIARSRGSGGVFLETRQSVAPLVSAERRFGDLLMIDIQAGASPAVAILDTAAQISIANTAFARAANASPITLRDGTDRGQVQSPTGRTAEAAAMVIPRLRFADMSVRRLPLLVGDFHTFGQWGIADRPAMLMGLDILGLFDTVAIDLRRGEVVFAL